jgi:type IV pilus assembly protein PilB
LPRARDAWNVPALDFTDAAITELLDLSDRIREMIVNRRPTSEIKRAAREEGMTFLRDSGLAKVRQGATTLKEINKVTFIE